MKTTASAALAALCIALAALPARAQVGYNGTGTGQPGGFGSPTSVGHHGADDADADKDKPKDKPEVPPPAIPGAEPDVDSSIIPAEKTAADLSPNEALFDAITRGDLNAAKDALNRGAQLDAHNVLGQTPTDAAIDLSRNDITFLLLSMRGAAPALRKPHVTQAALPPPPGKHLKSKAILQAKAQQQRTLSADRGTPNPAVGFTGF